MGTSDHQILLILAAMNMLRNKIITKLGPIALVFFVSLLISSLESPEQENKIRIMFYNLENLFDTTDNPLKNDDDFLPNGKYRWTKHRYKRKIDNIAKVILDVGENAPPVFIGLCEIENEHVANYIVSQQNLREYKLEYIVPESKDRRGSNVGIIYRPDYLTIFSILTFTPNLSNNKTTRDILYTGCTTRSNDTLDIFVCHSYSRREGEKQTEQYRMQIASLLKQKTDSIMQQREKANIIIMGDFNDYPDDKSISEVLGVKEITDRCEAKQLYNLCNTCNNEGIASYKYKKEWGFFDQMIVNGAILNDGTLLIKKQKIDIFAPNYLLEEDKQYGGVKPFRTYRGNRYLGGISDHLPIFTDIEIQNK